MHAILLLAVVAAIITLMCLLAPVILTIAAWALAAYVAFHVVGFVLGIVVILLGGKK